MLEIAQNDSFDRSSHLPFEQLSMIIHGGYVNEVAVRVAPFDRIRYIYSNQDFCVPQCRTTASDTVRIDPSFGRVLSYYIHGATRSCKFSQKLLSMGLDCSIDET
jgi:hypothetical protein